ncbi:MAG: ABC transporter permease [bacterium]
MLNKENLIIGFVELRANKMRTFLTMLGIVFGVGAVIGMLSIGEGARQETLEQIELLGTNNIIINKVELPKTGETEKVNFSPGLNIKDANSISVINPYVEYVTPQRSYSLNVSYKSKLSIMNIIGTTENYPQTFNSTITEGMFFQKKHMDGYANVCVIGYGVKEEFFRFEDPVNKQIKINDMWFKVIGVLSPKNVTNTGIEKLGLRDFNNDIYIPFTTMSYKLTPPLAEQSQFSGMVIFIGSFGSGATTYDRSSVDQLTVKIKDNELIKEAAELTERIMKRKHFNTKDYEVVIPEALLEQKQKTQKIFNVVMGAIAGISLLVGGIGIMNIMLANILERTREIGIRRAVGATRKDILNQFMYEAMIISIAGGITGIAIGFLITSLITSYAEWRTIITPFSILLAFIVSVCVGLIFGIYPAKKAADKDPIESLRYE